VLGALPPSGDLLLSVLIPQDSLPASVEGIEVFAQTLLHGQGIQGVLGSPSVCVVLDAGT
jgi:hypothetical protein